MPRTIVGVKAKDEGNCGKCGKPLLRLKWNSTTDVIVCDDYRCDAFRRPLAPKESLIQVGKNKREKYEVPDWLGGPYDPKISHFARRLQGLQERISSQG